MLHILRGFCVVSVILTFVYLFVSTLERSRAESNAESQLIDSSGLYAILSILRSI